MMQESTLKVLRREAVALRNTHDVDAISDMIGNARVVLLGEATHGTHEFYQVRAEITKRLISEQGFSAVAVEADWPDAMSVNDYLHGKSQFPGSESRAAEQALGEFRRFPQWMWRNADMLELVRWLRRSNADLPAAEKAGFFGIDLYSLHRSMDAVLRYLEQVDPLAARQAKTRYACFDQFGEDPQQYGYGVRFAMRPDCEKEVVAQLAAMVSGSARAGDSAWAALSADDNIPEDEAFYAEQNARVVQNAESYYRTMFLGRDESWNVRDTHMADTVDALAEFLGKRRGGEAKLVVWAHNSHIGDARATEMGKHRQINLGQLMRERHGNEAFLLGFTTHCGTVTAASDWDSPAEVKQVRPSLDFSYERLFHDVGKERFLLPIRGNEALAQHLRQGRLERAIGVIYLPERERYSHYFYADMSRQFDAVVHIDLTRAVKPLDRFADRVGEDLPETYPSGI